MLASTHSSLPAMYSACFSSSCHSECLEVALFYYDVRIFVVVPPTDDISPRIRWRDGSCVHLQWRGSKRALFAGCSQFIPSVFLHNTFFWRESTKDACLTQLVFLCKTPSLRKVSPASTLVHHVHPVLIDFQYAFWKGLQPSAGSWGTKGTPCSPPFTTSEG